MVEYSKIEELTGRLDRYVNTNCEIIKLEATERCSSIGSSVISNFIVGIIGIMSVLFISLWLGFYLSTWLGDTYSGFGIVAGFYFLLGIFLLLVKRNFLERPIRDKIIRKFLNKNLVAITSK